MNIHTFSDAVSARRSTIADQLLDDDEDEVDNVGDKKRIEGEDENVSDFKDVSFLILSIILLEWLLFGLLV